MEIKDSVSIVTGGVSGLGEATARSLVNKGGKVALLDLNVERGEKVSAELGDSADFFGERVQGDPSCESGGP